MENREKSYVHVMGICKQYKMGDSVINACKNLAFEANKGEFVVVVGPSGSGKTTILNILGGMDTADKGYIYVDGTKITSMKEKQRTDYRRFDVGFVFQFYNLVQNLTAKENVELAAEICKDPMDAEEALKQVGLEDRMNNFPAQLSGGEQQRVSIARALAKNPKLLLCDEPTGALDYETGKQVLKTLYDCCKKNGQTVILITHNQAITAMADRIIRIRGGHTSEIIYQDHPTPIEEIEW